MGYEAEVSWNQYVAEEMGRLLASHHCLRCRLNRRVMTAIDTLEKLVRHNADDRSVETAARNVKEFNADAMAADHSCDLYQ